ncbi:hypothetical protein GQ457_08G013030 [Hibiscus cannabinus]
MSTLNPNAPLFVPAVYRQVEDFSPEWWQLVTTMTWYQDYWISQHQNEDGFYDITEDDVLDDNDIADWLSEAFDLVVEEDLLGMDLQLEDFIQSYEMETISPPLPSNGGIEKDTVSLMKDLSVLQSSPSIEKILGEAEREHNLIFRPPTPPEQPRTPPFVPHRPASPRVPSPRVASPRVASPRAASTKSASSPRAASPSPPRPPPPRTASPRVASPRGASPKAAPPRIVRPRPEPTLRNQHASANQIQAAYRGYKAMRSFRALKGLVRLQGVVRGQNARRQTTNAMKHMQLLVRVQFQIQSHRIQMFENQALYRFKNDKEAESTLGKWISQASEAGNENWDDSVITKEEREARKQRKVEAAIKRKRAMAYAYSNQIFRKLVGNQELNEVLVLGCYQLANHPNTEKYHCKLAMDISNEASVDSFSIGPSTIIGRTIAFRILLWDIGIGDNYCFFVETIHECKIEG